MKTEALLLFLALTAAVSVRANAEESAGLLTLAGVEKSAAEYSPQLKSLVADQQAARERASTQKTQYYPKFYLDGSYKYVTEVPQIELPIPGFNRSSSGIIQITQ